MGQSKSYQEKYQKAKEIYLKGEKSLTLIAKELQLDRGKLSNNLKVDGIEVINKQNITKFNENKFDVIDIEEKAYWLGFLYADGAIALNRNTIELSLKSSDINHLEKFIKFLEFKDKHIFQDAIRCRVAVTNKHLKQTLIKLGCTPQKSLTLTFPDEDQVPKNLIHHFVRGYVDGDGSVMLGKDYKGVYAKPRLSILGTEQFLIQLIKTMNWKEAKIQHPSGAYSVEWGGKYVKEYLDSLYKDATIYLDRKYEKYQNIVKIFADDKSRN